MMHSSQKFFVFIVGLTVIGASFFVAQQGFAWTNPTTNPPSSNPLITISGTNVGMGVTPSAKLHVVGSESRFGGVASGYISIYNASGRSGYIQANQGTDLRIAADNDPMTFYTSNAERVRINTAGNLSVGTASPDANYKITTANGGIKADANTGQAAGYFNNIGGGPAIIAGTGGITLGGVNQTSWPSGNDNLGNHTATAPLNMAGNNISGVNFLTLSGAITPNAVGVDSGMTGARHYQFGYQEGGPWTNPYPDLILGYHTGLKLGAYNGYSGTRFYNDHPSIPGALEIFSVGNGDNHVRVLNNLYVTGNVGIGTSAPAVKLQVNGSVRGDQSGALRIDSGSGMLDVGAMNASYAHFQTDRPAFYFNKPVEVDGSLKNYSNAYYLAQSGVSYLNGGNVGIGTTDPTSQMAGTSGIGIYNASYPGIGFKNGTTSWLWYGASDTFRMWNSSAGEVLTAKATGGYIGIGNTNPVAKLDLGTSGYARTYSSGGSGWGGSTNTAGFRTAWDSGYGASFEAWDGGTPKWGIYKWSANTPAVVMQGQYNNTDINFTGNIAVGTTDPAGYRLNVNGDANATRLCISGDCKSAWPSSTDNTRVLKTGDTMSGNLNFGGVGLGTVGTYDATKTQAVWAMGPSYILPAGGGTTNYGTLYGLGWSYEPNYGGAGNNPQSKAGLSHQLLVMHNGITKTAIGDGIWTSGNLTFGLANPYINASSYLIIPGGAYFSGGTVYANGTIQARGGVHDDSNANLTISGGTSGNTTFTGSITTSGTISAGAVYNPTYAP